MFFSTVKSNALNVCMCSITQIKKLKIIYKSLINKRLFITIKANLKEQMEEFLTLWEEYPQDGIGQTDGGFEEAGGQRAWSNQAGSTFVF